MWSFRGNGERSWVGYDCESSKHNDYGRSLGSRMQSRSQEEDVVYGSCDPQYTEPNYVGPSFDERTLGRLL